MRGPASHNVALWPAHRAESGRPGDHARATPARAARSCSGRAAWRLPMPKPRGFGLSAEEAQAGATSPFRASSRSSPPQAGIQGDSSGPECWIPAGACTRAGAAGPGWRECTECVVSPGGRPFAGMSGVCCEARESLCHHALSLDSGSAAFQRRPGMTSVGTKVPPSAFLARAQFGRHPWAFSG